MAADCEDSQVMAKDQPDTWHALPVAKDGTAYDPSTKGTCERHMYTNTATSTPSPTFGNTQSDTIRGHTLLRITGHRNRHH